MTSRPSRRPSAPPASFDNVSANYDAVSTEIHVVVHATATPLTHDKVAVVIEALDSKATLVDVVWGRLALFSLISIVQVGRGDGGRVWSGDGQALEGSPERLVLLTSDSTARRRVHVGAERARGHRGLTRVGETPFPGYRSLFLGKLVCRVLRNDVPSLAFGRDAMHPQDLDHKELLELDAEGGVIRFAGQRALLLDAVAMGLLRKYLVENFGLTAARAVLTQFGFAHGWRMAEAMQAEFQWDSEEDWRRAGPRIHTLEGLFRIEPGEEDPLSQAGTTVLASYEAEQHLLHFGRADSAVCWTISGLTSGYVSRTAGKDIYVLEDRCMGKGDVACHLLGRTPEEWGDERAEELRFFSAARLEECLDVSLRRVTETLKAAEQKLRAHRRALVRVAPDVEEPLGIVAKSRKMSQVVDLARRVAKVDATVLITGESGSGKERIARLVHDESARASGPFIAINCGAITESLFESELFGHARGAFTGATQDRPGLFEAAHRGTLLLDEVGEVSTAMQVKLLRVLQEGEVRRVGENKSRGVDVRILAATNRDLAQGVSGGAFRQDLYYRLKVVELIVPPLRERRDDILPLARVLLAGAALRMKRKVSGISPPAADQLLRYGWPGNVRELENAMERAVALAPGGRVDLDDLPEEIRRAVPGPVAMKGAVRQLDQIEKEYILSALEANEGNQTHTARQLGIGSATLYRRLKSYGLINDR